MLQSHFKLRPCHYNHGRHSIHGSMTCSMVILFRRFPYHRLGSKLSSVAASLFDVIPNRDASKLPVPFPERDPGSFNSIVSGLAKDGLFKAVLESFSRMNGLGAKPTKYILCTVLNSCSKVLDIRLGSQVHAQIIRNGHERNLFLSSALVDLYAKSGATTDARSAFDSMEEHDQVSWTSIISGYSQNGCGMEALILFKEMLKTDVRPNCFTFASIVSASTRLEAAFQLGTVLHAHVVKLGFEPNTFVMSSLFDFYAKLGEIDPATSLFDSSLEKDTILYNSMIAGYSQNMLGEEAFKLFMEMRGKGTAVTDFTFSSLLNACGGLTVLQQGKQLHSLICKIGSDKNMFVLSSLIDMYSKCGSIGEARRSFDFATEKNSVLWTSMIMGYAQNGRGSDGLELFDQLVKEGGKPDHICFTAVLTACNHAGLLDKGMGYFDIMISEYGMVPELDQYACMVDLYGRNGLLRKAKELMETMPFEPNAVMWSSLLGSCRAHGDIELGKEAATQLFKMEPSSSAPYVALANTYAKVGKWVEVAGVRRTMKDKGVRRCTGWSWIEVDNKVHVFSASYNSHPLSKEMYAELDKINLVMKETG